MDEVALCAALWPGVRFGGDGDGPDAGPSAAAGATASVTLPSAGEGVKPGPRRARRRRGTRLAAVAVIAAVATAALVRAQPHPAPLLDAGGARGPFPRGCVWRDAEGGGDGDSPPLEYLHGAAWAPAQPAACRLEALVVPWNASASGPPPVTRLRCGGRACTLTNLWLARGALYAILDPGSPPIPPLTLSRNLKLVPLRVADAGQFARAAAPARVQGATLLLDYPFWLHSGAIGHWAELAAQAAGALGVGGGRPPARPDTVLLLHAPRPSLGEWVRTALAAAVAGPDARAGLPPVLVQGENAAPRAPLERAPEGWLLLDSATLPRDAVAGGRSTFARPEIAAEWRARFHRAAGARLPRARARPPRRRPSILLLRKSANRRLVNEAALVAALGEVGDVRVAEWGVGTPVAAQLAALSSADLLVSAHTSALAAVHLLPPNSAVLELIHPRWGWGRLDASFRDAAAARGRDVRHAALRAPPSAAAAPPDDARRFGVWSRAQCGTEACVEAAAGADFLVDVRAAVAAARSLLAGGQGPPWPE